MFLISIFIFWLLFGWFADYSFPFSDVIALISCCFGNIPEKVNILQKQIQATEFVSQPDNKSQVKALNEKESQAWLYIKVIELLGNNSADSNKRIAKTIEALEQKRNEFLQELEPRRPIKYRILATVQDFFRSIILTPAEKDYIQIEKVINKFVQFLTNIQPSNTVGEEFIDIIGTDIARNAQKITPSRLKLLYNIEYIVEKVLEKNIDRREEAEVNNQNKNIINDLKLQRELLAEQFKKLLQGNLEKQNEIDILSYEITKLNGDVSGRHSEIASLREQMDRLTRDNCNKQNLLNEINEELVRNNDNQFDLESQLSTLQQQVNLLIQQNSHKQSIIERMSEEIASLQNNISENESQSDNDLEESEDVELPLIQRELSGKYIGNISAKGKYYFKQTCSYWKSLVAEYLFMKDDKRQIVNSNNYSIFIQNGLTPCEFCSKNKK